MYGNRISTLPHEVCNLKKLRKLAVNENLLGTLPGLSVVKTVLFLVTGVSCTVSLAVVIGFQLNLIACFAPTALYSACIINHTPNDMEVI